MCSLHKLTWLSLQSTPLKDGTLGVLASLPSLQHLDLDRTPISDESITDLAHLTGLKTLTVMGLSDQGMKELQQALPNCNVIRGPAQLFEIRP